MAKKQITVLLFTVLLATSAITGTVAAQTQQTNPEPNNHQTNIQQQTNLQEEEQETNIYLLHLEPHRPETDLSRDALIEYMKEHSEETQEPVIKKLREIEPVKPVNKFWLVNVIVAKIDKTEIEPQELVEIDGIKGVTKSRKYTPLGSNTNIAKQINTNAAKQTTWGVRVVNAPKTWNKLNAAGDNVKVAVLDTGIDPNHPDIKTNLKDFAEFGNSGFKKGTKPHDTANHGTHTSGTVVGGSSSGKFIGVAPEADLLHGLVLNNGGTTPQIIGGMQWAIQKEADITSMSLGSPGHCVEKTHIYRIYTNAIRNSNKLGTLVVAASGNKGKGCISSPGSNYEALTVGAINNNLGVWSNSNGKVIEEDEIFSSYNKFPPTWPFEYVKPDVVAPGVGVFSAASRHTNNICRIWRCKKKNGNLYAIGKGTSMATPHVSGVAALVISASRGDPPVSQIRRVIEETAWKPQNCKPSCSPRSGNDTRYGTGIVDAYAASKKMKSSGIKGIVIDGARNPIRGAEIEVKSGDDLTNKQGSFGLSLLPGTYQVTVDASGYKPKTKTVKVTTGYKEVNFQLKKSNPEKISNCRTIQCPGKYILNQNLKTGSSPCIEIRSSNVTLDGNGYKIIGGGIKAVSANNIEIKNVEITKSNKHGIVFENTDDSQIHSSYIHSNSGMGILLKSSENNTIGSKWQSSKSVKIQGNLASGINIVRSVKNKIYQNNLSDRITLNSGSNNVIWDNKIFSASSGITAYSNSNNNKIKSNLIVNPQNVGILIENSDKNNISNNGVRNLTLNRGIYIKDTQDTNIENNRVNEVKKSEAIYVESSRDTHIIGNTVKKVSNGKGISVVGSKDSNIKWNDVSRSKKAIFVYQAKNKGEIRYNRVLSNINGIVVKNSGYIVSRNIIRSNNIQYFTSVETISDTIV